MQRRWRRRLIRLFGTLLALGALSYGAGLLAGWSGVPVQLLVHIGLLQVPHAPARELVLVLSPEHEEVPPILHPTSHVLVHGRDWPGCHWRRGRCHALPARNPGVDRRPGRGDRQGRYERQHCRDAERRAAHPGLRLHAGAAASEPDAPPAHHRQVLRRLRPRPEPHSMALPRKLKYFNTFIDGSTPATSNATTFDK